MAGAERGQTEEHIKLAAKNGNVKLMRSPEVLSKMEIEKGRERETTQALYRQWRSEGGGGRGGLINNKIRNQKLNECPFVIMAAGADNADDDDDDAACVSACLPVPPFSALPACATVHG